MKKNALITYFIYLWLIGSLGSFVLQFFFPTEFGLITNWGISFGWQREIAIWNVGISAMIVFALKNKSPEVKLFLVTFLSLLSILLSINHLHSLIVGSVRFGNILGFTANILAGILGGLILFLKK